MKDVLATLKTRRQELRQELVRIEKALAALEGEKKPPVERKPVSEEARRNMSEAQRRRFAARREEEQPSLVAVSGEDS